MQRNPCLIHEDRLQFRRKWQVLTFAYTDKGEGGFVSSETDMKNWESDSQMQKVWVLQCLVLFFTLKSCKRHLAGAIFLNSHTGLGPSLFKMPVSCCDASATWAFYTAWGGLFFFLVFWMNTSIICRMYSKGLCSSPQEKMLLSQNTEGISRW